MQKRVEAQSMIRSDEARLNGASETESVDYSFSF
jgi:hypothetical protein